MNCPECGSFQQRVFDSRSGADTVRRKRLCLNCGHRWQTLELAVGKQTRMIEEMEALRKENMRLMSRLSRAASDMTAAAQRLTAKEEQND